MGDSTELMGPSAEETGAPMAHAKESEQAGERHGDGAGSIPGPRSAFSPFRGGGALRGEYIGRGPDSFIPRVVAYLRHQAGACSVEPAQRRVLTNPAEPCRNDGLDNENDDLIMLEEDAFAAPSGRTYVVREMLGQGTFGQVAKCWCAATGEYVAVKVIKNQAAYYHQARMEIEVLRLLNTRCDPEDKHHIVRLHDFFVHRKHLCLVFELLSINLYELVKHNQFRGFSMNLLRVFLTQILNALVVLRDARIIHCDLKPENVLLKGLDSGEIKVIDFGSACFANRTVYSYIQSRFYRSPEVLLGHPYTMAIDMWSFGCVAAEMFLGLPLFPGASEYDLLARIIEMLGVPPHALLVRAKHTAKYFSTGTGDPATGAFQLRPQQEFEAHNQQAAPVGKRYFKHSRLADIIGAYPMPPVAGDAEVVREHSQREAFLDLLLGVLELEPGARWSPRQALQHPFFTGEAFTGPYQPPADTLLSPSITATSLRTSPLQIPGGSPSHPAPAPHHNGLYAGSWAPGSWGASSGAVATAGSMGHASSLGNSLGGLPGSWAMPGSPAMVQMHAHAAAMAAISQMSPRLSPMAGGSYASGGQGSQPGSLLAGSQPPPPPPPARAAPVPMAGATAIPAPRSSDGSMGRPPSGSHPLVSPSSSLGPQPMMGFHSYHSAIAHAAAVQALGRSAPQAGFAGYSTSPHGQFGGAQPYQQGFGSLSGSHQAMSAASIAAAMAARNSHYSPHQVAQAAAQAAFQQASSGNFSGNIHVPAPGMGSSYGERHSPAGSLGSGGAAMAMSYGAAHSPLGAAMAAANAARAAQSHQLNSSGLSSASGSLGRSRGSQDGQPGPPYSAGGSWRPGEGFGTMPVASAGSSGRRVAFEPPDHPLAGSAGAGSSHSGMGGSLQSAPIPAPRPPRSSTGEQPTPPEELLLEDSLQDSASPEAGDPSDYLPWFSDDQLIEDSAASSERQPDIGSHGSGGVASESQALRLSLHQMGTLALEPSQLVGSAAPGAEGSGAVPAWPPSGASPAADPPRWHPSPTGPPAPGTADVNTGAAVPPPLERRSPPPPCRTTTSGSDNNRR